MSYERLRDDLAGLTYHDHPVGEALTEQVRIQIEDMKLIKVIDPDTDAAELARRITTNVLA